MKLNIKVSVMEHGGFKDVLEVEYPVTCVAGNTPQQEISFDLTLVESAVRAVLCPAGFDKDTEVFDHSSQIYEDVNNNGALSGALRFDRTRSVIDRPYAVLWALRPDRGDIPGLAVTSIATGRTSSKESNESNKPKLEEFDSFGHLSGDALVPKVIHDEVLELFNSWPDNVKSAVAYMGKEANKHVGLKGTKASTVLARFPEDIARTVLMLGLISTASLLAKCDCLHGIPRYTCGLCRRSEFSRTSAPPQEGDQR